MKLCDRCRTRPGTRLYADDGTALAHGWIQRWCDICVLRKQLTTAKEQAERIPDLTAKLALAEADDEATQPQQPKDGKR